MLTEGQSVLISSYLATLFFLRTKEIPTLREMYNSLCQTDKIFR